MKTVAIVTDAWAPQVNGVVHTLQRTCAELRSIGIEPTIFSPDAYRSVPCPTYPEIRLALMPGRELARRLDAARPDALHIATEGPLGWAARRHALDARLPFTTAYHTRFAEYLRARTGVPLAIGYRVLRRFHQPSSCVMVPTRAVQMELQRHGFERTELWGRGVDTELFSPAPSNVFDGLPRPIFLSVGRVAIEKNLDAFLRLPLPGSKVIIGDGPRRALLQRRFPDAIFLGARAHAELPAFYRAADVFVFPSLTDTFGLVLLEAMGCGLPVAAYPVAGPLDVVGDSGAGVLRDDLREACMAALAIDRDHARRHAMSRTWSQATERFAALLHPR
ncbi:MAG: glycosyltransferase family 1 protein [Burkholderiales bacterium]|nr:glycosyltransferase family 1 protein [Burkholderiales bacterium]ODU69118.1 MAG: alpha-mannosyltransferase [Lautropia sp. SCN 66-9]